LHDFSMGHDRQFVALPAAVGFLVLLKYCRPPAELTVVGMWAGFVDPVGGEQSNQRRRSISWQDFVRRDGAVVDSFRQFPLRFLACLYAKGGSDHIPDIAVGKMPPPNRLRMID
jgi:hypothetical protein